MVAIVLGGWWWCGRSERSVAQPFETEQPPEAAAQSQRHGQRNDSPATRAAAQGPAAGPRADTHEPATDADVDAASHPHPITSHHVRIQLENQFIQQLNDAVDLRDSRQIRALVARYRAEGFADVDKLGDGHAIIADCLEQPGEASRATARSFYDRERGSIIRRQLRRICLE